MTSSQVIPVVIGVDIGGTNTDAVLICKKDGVSQVLAEIKELTSSDVTSGVKKAVLRTLLQARDKGHVVAPIQVNIGTTHFVNAVVQGRDLAKVAVIRICGPVSEELPPFSDFPSRLATIIRGSVHLVRGGFRFDGKEHQPLDENELRGILQTVWEDGIRHVVYVGIFSPTRADQENRARQLTAELYPDLSVSVSHELGHIGLLERENATMLNECLKPLCKKTVSGFKSALEDIGITCPFFLTQNDGTIISSEGVLEQPVLTFASGPTNSMRGATFLSELKDAIVVDIGGTTTDVGVLKNGFPREASTQVRVAGVKTNFRMPDVVSIGLGGGSYVKESRAEAGRMDKVSVGPLSAGLNLMREALVFGDGHDVECRKLTATDVAVAAGLCNLGSRERVASLDKDLVRKGVDEIHRLVEEVVDKIKLSKEELPVIVVGGGSVLMDLQRPLKGASKFIIPEHFGVANAIGAALSKVSACFNTVVNLLDRVDVQAMDSKVVEAVKAVTEDPDGKKAELATNEAKKPFFIQARDQAIEEICTQVKASVVKLGADEKTLEVLEKQDAVLSYMPGNATQIKVKIVGDLGSWENKSTDARQWETPADTESILTDESTKAGEKQIFSATGQKLTGDPDDDDDVDFTKFPRDPQVDPDTGMWTLSEYDIECIGVGAGIYGCGGGASSHMGRLRAKRAIKEGKKMRVVTPDRLFKNSDSKKKKMVIVCAFIGAPLIMYEQAVSSSETTKALECLKDTYEIGCFKDDDLVNKEGVQIETTEGGCRFVRNYRPVRSEHHKEEYEVVGLMSAEIGGMNAIEPFLIAANLGLPILDADGMSRAFPEVQMFIPYMYNLPAYPVGIVGSGNYKERSVLLYSPDNKLTENFLRDVSIENGCSAGLSIPLSKEDVMGKTALYTVSSAWRLGDAILRARLLKEPVIEVIMRQEDAKHVLTGKIQDVQRETSGGFNRGHMMLEGVEAWQGQEMLLEFQNENLVILPLTGQGKQGPCMGCVPDLICVVDADTGEPVPVEELRYGMRVAVLLMPSHKLLRSQEALRWVGPQAFHYPDHVIFKPFRERKEPCPVPLI